MCSPSNLTVIVGHGLAGATLAWTLRLRGEQVLVIDAEGPVSASRVAAGLITPLSGPKLVTTWGWEDAWPLAVDFYRKLESLWGGTLLRTVPAVRLFHSEESRQRCLQKQGGVDNPSTIRAPAPELNPDWFAATEGAIEQPLAARLDTGTYLTRSRDALVAVGSYRQGIIDPRSDIVLTEHGVRLERYQVTARRVVFCQGYVGKDHPWFGAVKFNPAKGQLLRIHAPGVTEQRVIHSGLWMAGDGHETYRVGATFEWDNLDGEPTEAGRDRLLQQMQEFIRFQFEVVDQLAAVRPTMHDFRPVLGTHPECSQIAILNGLGTKGSLWSPWLAEMLVASLLDNKRLPSELDVARWFR
ncbi:NAD(P)/FAD-dependent oxidoreductase [Planctomicrobium sp. SH527]|uniref:NAD(P)/FAD-dependent oxidoreductase n=1 Tax=Planctomicrobium sp. SH527 TaxID=3448123 RepID=UPI003F5B9F29